MRGHLVVEAGPALFWALCISSIESWVDTCRRPAQGVPSMQQVVEIDSISPVSPHSPASLPPVRVVVPVEGQEPIMRDARLPPFSLSARHTDSLPPPRLAAASDDMPLLVAKLEEDARSREALMRIGYLKALAAKDNGVQFFVALPHSTIDWSLDNGFAIPIEERSTDEVTRMTGRSGEGKIVSVEIVSPGSPARNPAFDVTPARLVTGLITERGVCAASREGLLELYPERG